MLTKTKALLIALMLVIFLPALADAYTVRKYDTLGDLGYRCGMTANQLYHYGHNKAAIDRVNAKSKGAKRFWLRNGMTLDVPAKKAKHAVAKVAKTKAAKAAKASKVRKAQAVKAALAEHTELAPWFAEHPHFDPWLNVNADPFGKKRDLEKGMKKFRMPKEVREALLQKIRSEPGSPSKINTGDTFDQMLSGEYKVMNNVPYLGKDTLEARLWSVEFDDWLWEIYEPSCYNYPWRKTKLEHPPKEAPPEVTEPAPPTPPIQKQYSTPCPEPTPTPPTPPIQKQYSTPCPEAKVEPPKQEVPKAAPPVIIPPEPAPAPPKKEARNVRVEANLFTGVNSGVQQESHAIWGGGNAAVLFPISKNWSLGPSVLVAGWGGRTEREHLEYDGFKHLYGVRAQRRTNNSTLDVDLLAGWNNSEVSVKTKTGKYEAEESTPVFRSELNTDFGNPWKKPEQKLFPRFQLGGSAEIMLANGEKTSSFKGKPLTRLEDPKVSPNTYTGYLHADVIKLGKWTPFVGGDIAYFEGPRILGEAPRVGVKYNNWLEISGAYWFNQHKGLGGKASDVKEAQVIIHLDQLFNWNRKKKASTEPSPSFVPVLPREEAPVITPSPASQKGAVAAPANPEKKEVIRELAESNGVTGALPAVNPSGAIRQKDMSPEEIQRNYPGLTGT